MSAINPFMANPTRALRRLLWNLMAIGRTIGPIKRTIVWLVHKHPRLLGRWPERYSAYRLTMGKVTSEIQTPTADIRVPKVVAPVISSQVRVRHTVHQLILSESIGEQLSQRIKSTSDWLRRVGIKGDIYTLEGQKGHDFGTSRPWTELPMHDDCVVIVYIFKGFRLPEHLVTLTAPILLIAETLADETSESESNFARLSNSDAEIRILGRKSYAGVSRNQAEALALRFVGAPYLFNERGDFQGLSDALSLAGIIQPLSFATLPPVASGSIEFVGHINGSYSLARITRALALSTAKLRPKQIRIVVIEGSDRGRLDNIPPSELAAIEALAENLPHQSRPKICITHHYPPIPPPEPADLSFVLFPWEESLVPQDLLRKLETVADAVIAPTSFVKRVLIDSGIQIPVFNILQPPELTLFRDLNKDRDWPRRKDRFVFFHISSCFPRKGVDILLDTYAKTFDISDPVELVIKGFPNPHNTVGEQITKLRDRYPKLAPIVFINEDKEESEILELYRSTDVLVLPTRGEGFNMPAAEAFTSEIPTVLTAGSGHLDFSDHETAWFIDYRFAYSESHVKSPGSVWMEPDRADLSATMRALFENSRTVEGRAAVKSRVARARERIAQQISTQAWLDGVTHAADSMLAPSVAPTRPRVAWVSTWRTKCGIAEYSRSLLEHFEPSQFQVAIFGDQRTPEDGMDPPTISFSLKSWEHSIEGWRRHSANMVRFDPQIIVYQHNWGIFGVADFAAITTDARFRNAVVLIVLHNTKEMESFTAQQREIAFSAFQRADRILVHGIDDLNRMKDYGFSDRTTLLPHGVQPISADSSRPPISNAPPIIGSYGFILPHKGLDILIQALPIIQLRIPGTTLRLVNAQFESERSQKELQRCKELATQLGVSPFVEFISDFLPIEESLQHLRSCDALAFIYKNTEESASGAVRVALAAGRPVATTDLTIFDELDDARFILSDISPASVASKLTELLLDAELQSMILERQTTWVNERTWAQMATRLSGIMQALVIDRTFAEHQRR